MLSELNPCPFCGETRTGTMWSEHDAGSPKPVKRISVCCGACGAVGPEADSYEKAVVKWNKRKEGKAKAKGNDNDNA